jgi:hypothetical protein
VLDRLVGLIDAHGWLFGLFDAGHEFSLRPEAHTPTNSVLSADVGHIGGGMLSNLPGQSQNLWG